MFEYQILKITTEIWRDKEEELRKGDANSKLRKLINSNFEIFITSKMNDSATIFINCGQNRSLSTSAWYNYSK